ncbi:MAG: relaxase/mobilization nuclease domain-containing protein [Hyphomonadaceae bacterium]|nr:relaxase/mobilization nuclease domain-containing protein [Hyphomonadaceae bacterium]
MILKASQRSGGQGLAAHLMRIDENEHVEIHDVRGFASDDLKEAFKEAEAVSRATKCKQYLFSLSLNPPEDADVPVSDFEDAIDRIEDRLGLAGQPRVIVFHEKEGRRHAHCVWSRIDGETLTAKQMSFYKTKLQSISRELYLDHGWDMPRGFLDNALKDPHNFTLAEWQQSKRSGVDPRLFKAAVQDCWHRSDSPQAFKAALLDRGLWLAKGDLRGHVLIDTQGEVFSLARTLNLKTKEVRQRLGREDDLPSVTETLSEIASAMKPVIAGHIQQVRAGFQSRSATLSHKAALMRDRHRMARTELNTNQKARHIEETKERASRLPRGLSGLWSRMTGKFQAIRRENEAEASRSKARDQKEREDLVFGQLKERRTLQRAIRNERSSHAKQLLDLRSDQKHFDQLPGRERQAGRRRER